MRDNRTPGMEEGQQQPGGIRDFSEAELEATLRHALRMVGILAAVGVPVVWFAAGRGSIRDAGWQSVLLFLVGALIAATGIYEWQRLMMAVLGRFNQGGTARPMGAVLLWFFLRLALAAVLLYVSLRSLHGSVFALCAGLGLAVVALVIESIRLLRSWSL